MLSMDTSAILHIGSLSPANSIMVHCLNKTEETPGTGSVQYTPYVLQRFDRAMANVKRKSFL